MELMTQALKKTLPALYSQENNNNPTIQAKYFLPGTNWSWYALEFDGDDLFFGYVVGDFPELGYFRLSELACVKGAFGLPVERDLYFHPVPLHEIMDKVDQHGV
jgi:hypothetical protein